MLKQIINSLPDTNGCVVVLSGGLDSTTAMRLAVERYGAENVSAITFDYGQRQRVEIEKAKASTSKLGVAHKIIDMSFYGEINEGFSSNVKGDVAMPTIQDVIGDAQPKTYLANRNMVMLSIAAAYAETRGVEYIFCGIQSTDNYSYWDTTPSFAAAMNDVFKQNRKHQIKLIAPFNLLSKEDEVNLLLELDGNVNLLEHSLTCYNPNESGESCGKCPSCAERIAAFMNVGIPDPVNYSIDIPWRLN